MNLRLFPILFATLGSERVFALEEEAAELRPLSTDRPDVTESPRTVDAGHFQVEADLVRVTRDQGMTNYSIANTNLKLGILSFLDLQLVVESWVGKEEPDGREWGFGELVVRSKANLFGNDSGSTALALMPWAKIPQKGDELAEGGLILPVGFELPMGFGAGLMVEGDVMANETGDDHHFELLTSATLGRQIAGPLGGYLETFGVSSTEPDSGYALSLAGGLTCAAAAYLQLDAGAALGLTASADDVSVFTGVSYKY